jgi:hypothetical protein
VREEQKLTLMDCSQQKIDCDWLSGNPNPNVIKLLMENPENIYLKYYKLYKLPNNYIHQETYHKINKTKSIYPETAIKKYFLIIFQFLCYIKIIFLRTPFIITYSTCNSQINTFI